MAYNIININPLDLQPSKGVGIKVPFDGPTGLNITYTTKEAIKVNLINFLLTNPGERYLSPQFGGGIRQQVFEQISTGNLDMLKLMLTNRIQANFPMIDLAELKVLGDPNNNVVNVNITYNVVNFGITDNVDILFTNG